MGVRMSDHDKPTEHKKRVSPESFVRAFPLPASTPAAQDEIQFRLLPQRDNPPSVEKRWRIVLTPVEKPSEQMGLELLGDVVLGTDAEDESDIDVNLAGWQAGDRGVSRRHALLRPARDKL